MVARTLFITLFSITLFISEASGQDSRAGILRFNAGLAQGFMLEYNSRPLFVDGFAEYYADEKISIKGSCTQLVADRVENSVLGSYTGISFGVFRHFGKGMSDFGLGVQPGVVLEQPDLLYAQWSPKLQVTPSLMFSATYTLFFSKFFHFYVAASPCFSFYRGAPNGNINTSWFSITGGLGYHFRIKK